MSQAFTVVNPLASSGFRLIRSDSAEFATELDRLVDANTIKTLRPVLPLSVIVVNDTGRYIWGFGIIYTYPDALAATGQSKQYRLNPATGLSAGRDRMFAPGDHFLITPARHLFASRRADGTAQSRPRLDRHVMESLEAYKQEHSKPTERIQLQVDSIIFEDGEIVGPDSQQREKRINELIRAETSLLASISGLHGDDLKNALVRTTEASVTDEPTVHAKGMASSLLSVLDEGGEAEVEKATMQLRGSGYFEGAGAVRRRNNE